MKDYYAILGLTQDCSEADIRKAFRKLAFQHHPDKNPGREKQAEEKFKEINEAFGVLGDKYKRQQYDLTRKGVFTGAGVNYQGFQYTQQDIFNGIFADKAMFEEMSRMFSGAGLRFDPDFLNRVFSTGPGIHVQYYTFGGSPRAPETSAAPYKPGWLERMLLKIMGKLSAFALKSMLGSQNVGFAGQSLDHQATIEITASEAKTGAEKSFTYQRNGKAKNLEVRIPPGVKTGTRIRLKGMGLTSGKYSGDLFLQVKIKDESPRVSLS